MKDGRGNPDIKYMGADGGRASFRLDESMLEKLIGFTQMGNYKATAAKACGIGRETLYRWNKVGEGVYDRMVDEFGQDVADSYNHESTSGPWDDDAECHPNDWMCFRCWYGMNKAEAEAEIFAVGQVREAMKDNWTAAMTWLERKYPDRWKRRDLHEVAAVAAAEARGDEDALLSPEAQEALEAAMDAEATAIEETTG